MSLFFPVSSAPAALGLTNPWYWLEASLSEKLAMLGALALLTLGLVVWAAFFRKRRRRRSRHSYPPVPARLRTAQGYGASGPSRCRRRARRPRNPSLAEAGGLPPLRPQEPQETTG